MKTLFLKVIAILTLSATCCFAQQPGDIVITEFMANPAAVNDASGEWFEITNTSINTIDINGWHIMDNGSDDHIISNGGPLELFPGTILILSNNADQATNGGITPDYTYSGFTLSNSSDEIILTDAIGTMFDSVAYTSSTSGKSWSLDPSHLDATGNDDFANWCLSSVSYGMGDFGTPSAVNTGCSTSGIALNPDIENLTIRCNNKTLHVESRKSFNHESWTIVDLTGKIILSGIAPLNEMRFNIKLENISPGYYLFVLSENAPVLRFIVE